MSIRSRVQRLADAFGHDFKVEVLRDYFDKHGNPIEGDQGLHLTQSILVDDALIEREPEEGLYNFELRACRSKVKTSRQHVVLGRSVSLL